MEIKDFLDDLNIITKLGTFPNADDGLPPEELKEKFDESGKMVQKYINEHIVPAIRTLISMSGGRMEFRFVENTVQWRYLPQEGAPGSEWQALFTTDDIREKVAQEVLAEAQGYANDAAESAVLANEIATSAQGYCSQVYNDCLGIKSSAEQSAQQVKEAVAAVPKALPNPQKLILTGAVEAEYDGSGEVEVEIPVGGSKDVHVGSEPPTNGEPFWINHDEESEGGGAVSPEAIKQAVGEYMAEHPETDPTVPDWAKQPNKPSYTAAEVGALPADTPIPEGVTDGQIKNAVDAYLTKNPPEVSGGGWHLIVDAEITEPIRMITETFNIPVCEMSGWIETPPISDDNGTINVQVSMSDGYNRGITTLSTKSTSNQRVFLMLNPSGGIFATGSGSNATPHDAHTLPYDASLAIHNHCKDGAKYVSVSVYRSVNGQTLPVGVKIRFWGR